MTCMKAPNYFLGGWPDPVLTLVLLILDFVDFLVVLISAFQSPKADVVVVLVYMYVCVIKTFCLCQSKGVFV